MRIGEVKAVLLALPAIVLASAMMLLMQIEGPIRIPSILFAVVASSIFVGLPALFGIVAIQMPVARFFESKGALVQMPMVVTANIALTLTGYSIVSHQNVLREPNAFYVLTISATVAALLWFVLDRHFTRAGEMK